jgi:PKD repeat protein
MRATSRRTGLMGTSQTMTLGIGAMLILVSVAGCTGLSATIPRADISADLNEVNVGGTVNFDARDSSSPDPTIIKDFLWDFDDGGTRTTKTGIVSHIFLTAGNHDVEVVVVNDRGEQDHATITIFVNSPPTILIESPSYVRTGESATLDAADSFDPEGGPLEFIWDFNIGADSNGDGDFQNDADATTPITSLDIFESGNRTGKLTVVDDKGGVSTEIWTVKVITRNFHIVWEEQHVTIERSGYLNQGDSIQFEHEPGAGARMIQVNATLTLARDILPIMWPEDNFTLSLSVPMTGWNTFSSTTHDNITENATSSIERSEMNDRPESGYSTQADSDEWLTGDLLNQAGQRFGQGTWIWTVTADQCDPDFPVDGVDPDGGNDWKLVIEYIILVPRVSEIGI